MQTNERDVAIRAGATNFSTLKEFMDARTVRRVPFNETAQITVSGVNLLIVDATKFVATKIAVGVSSVENAGLFVTLLPGAVGTHSIAKTDDALGRTLNMVAIRDATTHENIEDSGFEVFALVHAVSTAVDGDTIGASGSETVQLSFCYIAEDGTITPATITATIEFMQNNLYLERLRPTILMESGSASIEVATIGGSTSATSGKYVVTTPFAANEIITLSTGAGASAGISTKSHDTINLGISASAFIANNLLLVLKNGVEQDKETDVIYDTSGSFHFVSALDIDDQITIRLLA